MIILFTAAILLIVFSAEMREGAYKGLALAENTIIPSLLPLLIIFLLIMKTGARDVMARAFGFVSHYLFNLPMVTFPAIIMGLVGGYPTGALLTQEFFLSQEIDSAQAARMLRFNFCGGCGFIITALGTATLLSPKAGLILFVSNITVSVLMGFALSFTQPRMKKGFYSYRESPPLGNAIADSAEGAIKSMLSITAFVIFFGAVNNIAPLPKFILPIVEITNGLCGGEKFSLPEISGYLAFGGLCIHMQLLPSIVKCGMKYIDFLFFRVLSALLSYCVTKLILFVFPMEQQVFSNESGTVAVFSSVNIGLSFLLIVGCFVLVLDISSRKRAIDN